MHNKQSVGRWKGETCPSGDCAARSHGEHTQNSPGNGRVYATFKLQGLIQISNTHSWQFVAILCFVKLAANWYNFEQIHLNVYVRSGYSPLAVKFRGRRLCLHFYFFIYFFIKNIVQIPTKPPPCKSYILDRDERSYILTIFFSFWMFCIHLRLKTTYK